jgi:hypothetical protein
LAQSSENVEKGGGLISIEIKNHQKTIKIREIAVTEGLLVRILELTAGWI